MGRPTLKTSFVQNSHLNWNNKLFPLFVLSPCEDNVWIKCANFGLTFGGISLTLKQSLFSTKKTPLENSLMQSSHFISHQRRMLRMKPKRRLLIDEDQFELMGETKTKSTREFAHFVQF